MSPSEQVAEWLACWVRATRDPQCSRVADWWCDGRCVVVQYVKAGKPRWASFGEARFYGTFDELMGEVDRCVIRGA